MSRAADNAHRFARVLAAGMTGHVVMHRAEEHDGWTWASAWVLSFLVVVVLIFCMQIWAHWDELTGRAE
jgi:hypothetical protein